MRTQGDRDLDLSTGREIERKDAEIARLRGALENAEQFIDLYVNGVSSIEDGRHTLAHIRSALILGQLTSDRAP